MGKLKVECPKTNYLSEEQRDCVVSKSLELILAGVYRIEYFTIIPRGQRSQNDREHMFSLVFTEVALARQIQSISSKVYLCVCHPHSVTF